MGLFFGRETRSATFLEPPVPPFLGANIGGGDGSYSGTSMRADTALTVPTVWACVSLLAGAVSSLPLETFRRDNTNGAAPAARIADPSVVTSPDEGMTQSEWLHMLMVSLLLRGNAYGQVTARDAAQRPTKVHLLNPDSVHMEIDKSTGRLVYRTGTDNHEIPRENVWHVRGLTMPGSLLGLSPIAYAAATLGVDLASRQFASGFFEGGGIPKAVLESDQQVNQDQARTIKDRVMSTLRGREPLVLGLGLKYTQIQVKPEESQFLATQKANVGQVARFFSVPAEMVGGEAGGSMTYSNREQRSLDFLAYSLSHWLKRIEDAMFVLLPGQQFVRFNAAALLRTDLETQARVDLQYLAGKAITPTEVRARSLGLPEMTEAQKEEAALVPLTVTAQGNPRINAAQADAEQAVADVETGAPTATGLAAAVPAAVTP